MTARPFHMLECLTPHEEIVHAKPCVSICAADGVKLQTAVEETRAEQPRKGTPENA